MGKRIPNLTTEARIKLETNRPVTLGAAKRMEGIDAATLMVLYHHIKSKNNN